MLCVLASLLALRVLLTLMKAYEQKLRRKLAVEAANARRTSSAAPQRGGSLEAERK